MSLQVGEKKDEGEWTVVTNRKKRKSKPERKLPPPLNVTQTPAGNVNKEILKHLRNWEKISETDLQIVKDRLWHLLPEYNGKKFAIGWHSGMHCIAGIEDVEDTVLHISASTGKVYKMTGQWNELLSRDGIWLTG